MTVKVRLFSKAEKMRRLNEAQNIASVSGEIEQLQTQIQQAEQDYMKRIEPLKKKLIELQAQLSTLQGQSAQVVQKPGQVAAQQVVPGQQPQRGVAAAPGATATTV